MKIQITEKQKSLAICTIGVFFTCLLLTIVVWRFSSVMVIVKKTISSLSPVIWGLVFAYLLSPLQNWLERRILSKLIERKKPHPALRRAVAVTVTIFILIAALAGMIAMLLPELIDSVRTLFNNIPSYAKNIATWCTDHLAGLKESSPQVYESIMAALNSLQDKLINFATQYEPKLDSIVNGASIIGSITSGAYSLVSGVIDFLIGIIAAIYLLYNKERYPAQIKKILYALFPEQRVHSTLRVLAKVHHVFQNFLVGQTVDCLMVGVTTFVGLTIMDAPYAALISLVVGVTNFIPFFGPFIGAIPSGFLVLIAAPTKLIPFVIFIFALQQIEGNLIAPKILGDSMGLPTFWVLFAILIGGGLFGFFGMVAFVPLFAALYALFKEFLAARLAKKGLPSSTEGYMGKELVYATPSAEASQQTPAENPAAEETAAEIASENGKDDIKNADDL